VVELEQAFQFAGSSAYFLRPWFGVVSASFVPHFLNHFKKEED